MVNLNHAKRALVILACSAALAAGLTVSSSAMENVRYQGCMPAEESLIDAELRRYEPYLGLVAEGIEVHCGDYYASSAEVCYAPKPGQRGWSLEEHPSDENYHLLCYTHDQLSDPGYRDTIIEEMAHVYLNMRAGVTGTDISRLNSSEFTRLTKQHMLCDGSSEELDPLDIYGTVFAHQAMYLFDESAWPGECFAKYLTKYLMLDSKEGSLQNFRSEAPNIYNLFRNEITKGKEPPF